MNVWVVRAEFGKYADTFRSGGYMAIDYLFAQPYPIGEGRDAFIEVYEEYNQTSRVLPQLFRTNLGNSAHTNRATAVRVGKFFEKQKSLTNSI